MPKGTSYDEGSVLPESRLSRYHRQPVRQVCVILVVNLEIVAQVRGETDIQGCRPVLGEIDLGPSDLNPPISTPLSVISLPSLQSFRLVIYLLAFF